MAMNKASLLRQNHEILHSAYVTLDPRSLILSQFSSDSHKYQFLQLTTQSFVTKRGPRYQEYSDLRDRRLRIKNMTEQKNSAKERNEKLQKGSVSITNTTPPTPKKPLKKVTSKCDPLPKKSKGFSALTHSVTDISSKPRKENQKPAGWLGQRLAAPSAVGLSNNGNSSEKKSERTMMMRCKSYANMEELKGYNRGGGRIVRGVGKNVLGYRKF